MLVPTGPLHGTLSSAKKRRNLPAILSKSMQQNEENGILPRYIHDEEISERDDEEELSDSDISKSQQK